MSEGRVMRHVSAFLIAFVGGMATAWLLTHEPATTTNPTGPTVTLSHPATSSTDGDLGYVFGDGMTAGFTTNRPSDVEITNRSGCVTLVVTMHEAAGDQSIGVMPLIGCGGVW